MTKVISTYEAPALLDLHTGLTRAELYNRLTGPDQPKGRIGLATCLGDGAMRFAQEEYGWQPAVQKTFTGHSTDGSLELSARAYITQDDRGPLAVIFLHLNDYLHRMTWSKAGVPPMAFLIQANWVMRLASQTRLAFLVLSDKRLMVYEIDRDEALVAQIADAVDAMAHDIATNSPPPADAQPQVSAVQATAQDRIDGEADLNALVLRYRATSEAKASAAYDSSKADHAAEAAADALKAALPKGSCHEVDGVRTYHNAKTGRLTEEKLDGQYF